MQWTFPKSDLDVKFVFRAILVIFLQLNLPMFMYCIQLIFVCQFICSFNTGEIFEFSQVFDYQGDNKLLVLGGLLYNAICSHSPVNLLTKQILSEEEQLVRDVLYKSLNLTILRTASILNSFNLQLSQNLRSTSLDMTRSLLYN